MRCMSWKLVRAIQRDTDLRLILPFGLALKVGDVVSVARSGDFSLQGSVQSLLGVRPGSTRSGQPVDLMKSSGSEVRCEFRAAGEASNLFPDAPTVAARFDIAFGSENSWLLAMTRRVLTSLESNERLRHPILNAYARGVWKPDWALITGVAVADRMTLLASRSRDTKLTLAVSGDVTEAAPLEAKLTAGASVLAANQELTQAITEAPLAIACAGVRVHERWFTEPHVGVLKRPAEVHALDSVSDSEFWEDMDTVLPSFPRLV